MAISIQSFDAQFAIQSRFWVIPNSKPKLFPWLDPLPASLVVVLLKPVINPITSELLKLDGKKI
jgi:hypothetical protein